MKTYFFKLTLSFFFAALTLGAVAQEAQSITYGTYFGGIGDDGILDLDLMPDGSIITGGRTGSFNLEVMQPYQQIYGGNSDAFIAIFSPQGALTYSSFFGGSEFDEVQGVRALPDGGYVVAGRTQSSDFPITAGAFQTEFSGIRVGFISRFSSDHTLLWSTYYGGDEISDIFGMAIDAEMNIYVHGNTGSGEIGTPGTHQEALGPETTYPAFIAKFSPDGERLWCTYFYGNDSEEMYWIEASADGQQLYAAGVTTSTTGIALNAHQDTYHGGLGDGFLCAFNAADGTMNWGTYYGGGEFEYLGHGVVEESGTLYLSGASSSISDIATVGSHQTELEGARDGFLVSFTPDGERNWGTYSGGEDLDALASLFIKNGALTVIGGTRSLTGIATAGAMYPENTVNLDAFPPRSGSYLTQFNSTDGTLRWGTYLMPECYRLGISKIMTASDNKLIIGGLVSLASILCPDIITPGAHQSFAEGSGEAVLMFIQDNTLSASSEDHAPLSLYPNPASREVVIDLPDAPFSHMHLQVIDLSGRVVLNVPAFAMGSAIDLDGMAPGLYLVKGAQAGHYFSEKLVVGR